MDTAIAIFRINESEAGLGSTVSHWKLGVEGPLKRWSKFSIKPGYTLKAETLQTHAINPPPKKNYKQEHFNTS